MIKLVIDCELPNNNLAVSQFVSTSLSGLIQCCEFEQHPEFMFQFIYLFRPICLFNFDRYIGKQA